MAEEILEVKREEEKGKEKQWEIEIIFITPAKMKERGEYGVGKTEHTIEIRATEGQYREKERSTINQCYFLFFNLNHPILINGGY